MTQTTMIYTKVDEAPALASYALLPVVKAFAAACGIDVQTKDISLAGRIIANFPENLSDQQKINDDLTLLGELAKTPEANVIKLPNISASIPQLQEAVRELNAKGYDIPDYPEEPTTDAERDLVRRFAAVLGSAVNPVLREGNSDRRAADSVKKFGKKHPHKMMKPWPESGSKARVAHMTEHDFFGSEKSVTFADAAVRSREAGFDAVELHLGHGYLLSQFLSPAFNRRTDSYGGSPEARLRFPLEVVRAVRAAVGPDFPVLAKTNLADGFTGGLQIEESIGVHRALEAEGIDAVVMSGGVTSRTPFFLMRGEVPVRSMVRVEHDLGMKVALTVAWPFVLRAFPFEELFFRDLALQVRAAVQMPLVLLGGVNSSEGIRTAMGDGFDFVAMGRALIADPDFVLRMQAGEELRTRCDQCNECVAEMDAGGVRCVLPPEA